MSSSDQKAGIGEQHEVQSSQSFGKQSEPKNLLRYTKTNTDALHAANSNKFAIVFRELYNIEPQLQNRTCPKCNQIEKIAITNEGVVLTCVKCGRSSRVDITILQQLAEKLQVTCFACAGNALKSEARSFGNILVYKNCGRNNSWRGLIERN